MKNPDELFELCLNTSLNFHLTCNEECLDEFSYWEDNACMVLQDGTISKTDDYTKKYIDSMKFTSLLFCCSIIYFYKIYNQEINLDPFRDKFDKPFLKAILSQAKLVDTFKMNLLLDHLNGCPSYWESDVDEKKSFEYQCINYLKSVAINIKLNHHFQENDHIENLAFNFYKKPGSFIYTNQDIETLKLARLNDINLTDEIEGNILYAFDEIWDELP